MNKIKISDECTWCGDIIKRSETKAKGVFGIQHQKCKSDGGLISTILKTKKRKKRKKRCKSIRPGDKKEWRYICGMCESHVCPLCEDQHKCRVRRT